MEEGSISGMSYMGKEGVFAASFAGIAAWEGSTVMTKYGPVKTDYMLFIAAGAFHVARVEDLIPELQGRFPVSVELTPLTKEDFINILTSTEHSLTRQYAVLLAVDNIDLKFTPDAIEAIARAASIR